MAAILVVGADTVLGANAVTRYSEDHEVHGVTGATPGDHALRHPDATLGGLPTTPGWVLLAGPTARSSWDPKFAVDAESARRWASACRARGIGFAYVSTDAVFDGPRLFHDESATTAATPTARAARLAEESVLQECPNALVVRTNVFGWSPDGSGLVEGPAAGWSAGHATPIHAGVLCETLLAAREHGLTGVLHAGGGERVDAGELAARIAVALEITANSAETRGPARETSLRSARLARALDGVAPMIDDGLARLVEERESGWAASLTSATATVPVPA